MFKIIIQYLIQVSTTILSYWKWKGAIRAVPGGYFQIWVDFLTILTKFLPIFHLKWTYKPHESGLKCLSNTCSIYLQPFISVVVEKEPLIVFLGRIFGDYGWIFTILSKVWPIFYIKQTCELHKCGLKSYNYIYSNYI